MRSKQNYNYETGTQMSTKYGMDIAEGMLLLCAKFDSVWSLELCFFLKNSFAPHAEPSEYFFIKEMKNTD